jgi:hypothetical protein
MKFSLPDAVVLFCATTALALPQTSNSNDVVARGDDGLDLSEVEITDVEISSVDFDAADFGSLEARDTKFCANQGKIKRVKKEYNGKCHPDNSRGYYSVSLTGSEITCDRDTYPQRLIIAKRSRAESLTSASRVTRPLATYVPSVHLQS